MSAFSSGNKDEDHLAMKFRELDEMVEGRLNKGKILNVGDFRWLAEQPKVEGASTGEIPTSLEELWAYGCVKLKSIRGLEHGTKRRIVSVCGMSELEELPSMEPLTSLEEFWADGCVKLNIIRGLEHATKLRILNVARMYELEDLPSMDRLTFLEELWEDGCVTLNNIRGLEHVTKQIGCS